MSARQIHILSGSLLAIPLGAALVLGVASQVRASAAPVPQFNIPTSSTEQPAPGGTVETKITVRDRLLLGPRSSVRP